MVEVIAGSLIGFLVASLILWANGVNFILKKNYLVLEARRAGFWWKIPGNALIAAAFWLAYTAAKDSYTFTQADPGTLGVVAAVLLALGVCCNCGFNFDISEFGDF